MKPEWDKCREKLLLSIVEVNCRQECDVLTHLLRNLENYYSPSNFWSLTWNNPDLVPKIRTQIRLLVNVGLRGGVSWLQGTSDIICPLCKVEPEDNFRFMLRCNIMKPEWDKCREKLLLSIVEVNCRQECNVLTHLLRNLEN